MKPLRYLLSCLFIVILNYVQAANRFWIASGPANWNNTANWSTTSGGAPNASIPGAGDIAIFNNNGLGNCTININITVAGITVNAGYTGTLIQGANTITTTGAATFSGGIFSGGTANITIGGVYTLSGTIFTSTNATLEFRSNTAFTSAGFTHNNGSVKYNAAANTTISGISPIFKNLEFVGNARTYTISSVGNITVLNTLSLSGASYFLLSTGTIDVNGDINVTNTATACGGSALINIVGTGTQNYTGSTTAGQGTLPRLAINKSSGVLNLFNYPGVSNNFTYTAGTINPGTSTFCFVRVSTGAFTITGTISLNNILFLSNTALTATIAAGTVLTVKDFTMSGTANLVLNTGTINVNGNIFLTNTATAGGGTTIINIVGTTNQSIDGTAIAINQNRLPVININKTTGTLSLAGFITFTANVTYTAGTINPGVSTCAVANSLTMTGTFSLYNLTVNSTAAVNFTIAAGSTVTTKNDLVLANGAFNININAGTLAVQGNISITNTATGGGGSGTILINGSNTQNISSTGVINQGRLPAVTINKSGGTLVFPSLITVRGNWTYTAGTIDVATNNSNVVFNNTLSFAGTHSLNNITLEGNANYTFTFNTGTILTVTGTLSTIGGSNVTINTPVAGATGIWAKGDISITNTGAGGGGTAAILINGTGAQALSSTSAAGQGRLPFISIQKTSGTLSLSGIISESRSWTYSSGTVNAGTSTVVFGGNNLTITSAGMNFYNATVTSNTSTLANSFSVNNDLTINGSGILSAGANTINVGGNWANRATAGFTEATSTVHFNGASLQTITTPGGENFTNLIIDNAGAGIQLASNIAAATSLNMTKGNIDLNGNIVTLGTSAANIGTLARTTGTMINSGSFRRWFNTAKVAAGAIAGLFPVGTATDYRPFSISNPTTGPTTGGTITVSYTNATTNSIVSFPDGVFTVVIRKDLNWAVSTGNGLNGGGYDLNIQGTGYGKIGNVSDLRLTLVNSVVGTAGVNGGTNSNPSVNRTSLTIANLANTYYLSSINLNGSTLPVTYISFTANPENDFVKLDWMTATEQNNDHFTVQRSADGKNWDDIKSVDGSGNTTTATSYTTYDENPLSGTSYYRLKQTDMDGRQSYSIIRIVVLNKMLVLNVYPNPASDYIVVSGTNTEKVNIILFNSNGQRMNIPIARDGVKSTLYVSNVMPGIYFIQIIQGTSNETRKITIVK
ncbi:MAG: T9SS type A sorting domain-containing protein [Bacteroidetes bacterium]|nr:T9SS type A sorting domain-containing protein [Bacteroidota bacterium]